MSTRLQSRILPTAVTVSSLLVAVLLQGCWQQANGNVDKKSETEAAAIPVEVATVREDDVAAYYSGTTTIEADEQATVVSQITGVVLEIHAEEGQFVEAGTVLARVEPDRYRLEVDRNDADLKRLQMDHVDLYQIHRWDYDTPIEETMEPLRRHRRAVAVVEAGHVQSDGPVLLHVDELFVNHIHVVRVTVRREAHQLVLA